MRIAAVAQISFAGFLVLAGCSSSTPVKKAEKKEAAKPEPIEGQKAFFQMYQAARTWAADIEPLVLQSVLLNSVEASEGKYPAWKVTFVSQSRGAAKTYSYSAIEGEGFFKGVFGGPDESYRGPSGQTAPFPFQAIKSTSTKAYEIARKEGEAYDKKFPGKPITIVLEKTKEYPNPTWRVMWGTSPATAGYSVYVDASSGEFLKKR